MAQWKDVSGKGFNAWEIRLGIWRLSVVYNHRDYPGKYIYYIPGVVGDTLMHNVPDDKQAKMLALSQVETLASQILESTTEALEDVYQSVGSEQ